MARSLPTAEETVSILARRRTRPPPRPPPVAGRALAATLKSLDARFGKGADGLKARWSEIVGPELSRRTEPTRLTAPKGGGPAMLEIRVEGPSAAIIQHQAPDILARVNLFLGKGKVDRLRIVQGLMRGQARVSHPAGPGRRFKAPLDAAAEADLAASLAAFPEGPLKLALARLGRELLRSTKPDV